MGHYRAKIQYIFHNCFLLNFGEKTFLFDIPSYSHLTREAREILLKGIKDIENLFVFFSHAHEDHFNSEFVDIIKNKIKNYNFFISHDIYATYSPKFQQHSYILEPEEDFEINELKIKTYESNDLGNAYLIFFNKIKIYFGGDLAEWIWPDAKEEEKRFIQNYFEEILEELAGQKINIAFSNVDPRLKNYGGGIKFINKVKPDFFIPMHTFGQYTHITQLKNLEKELPTKIFTYSKIGQTFPVELQ